MDINLKVSPAELEAKATDFKGVMSQIKTLTDDMMADVTGLSSTWTGDASAAYISKFKKLQTDMDTMGRMINEHVTNLTNMAKDYTSTESSNASATDVLSGNVISQQIAVSIVVNCNRDCTYGEKQEEKMKNLLLLERMWFFELKWFLWRDRRKKYGMTEWQC